MHWFYLISRVCECMNTSICPVFHFDKTWLLMSIFIHGDLISTVEFGANCLIKNFILFYFFKLTINSINITGNFSSINSLEGSNISDLAYLTGITKMWNGILILFRFFPILSHHSTIWRCLRNYNSVWHYYPRF